MIDYEQLRERALEFLALDAASDTMGIYPKAVTGGDKPYEKRTEWMEGWKAYDAKLTKTMCAIQRWLDGLPKEHKTPIEDHLLAGNLNLSVHDDECKLWVNCSDLFYWATADSEEFAIDDLPSLNRALEESPKHGTLLWCCRKRGMRPQRPYYKYFSEEEKPLFDAAGPERT